MLWRLVAKILLKACLPMMAVAGVMTYGVYLRGGDPGSMLANFAERGVSRTADLFMGVGNDASEAVNALSQRTVGGTAAGTGSAPTELFTWKDGQGITHFASSPPPGVEVSTIRVNPDVNVLAPVAAGPEQASKSTQQDANQELAEEFGGRLPGMAGEELPTVLFGSR